jgi:8-oxo-dGTP diphosphatase
VRAVFHEQDDAETVVARLRREGWDAMVAQDRFAGEDDDEDHAWAVLTDAPEVVLELLTEEHDGWVDHAETPASRPASPSPLDLPDGPRRIKGHFTE